MMKPILMNTEMVKMTIAGVKTETRRPLKLKPEQLNSAYFKTPKPPVQLGDILYVRETWQHIDFAGEKNGYVYKASEEGEEWEKTEDWKWKPSIHMPKEAARLFLLVEGIDFERLNAITEQEAINEGIRSYYCDITKSRRCKDYIANSEGYGHPDQDYPTVHSPISSFNTLWHSIYGNAHLNPFVWVIKFKRVEKRGCYIS